MDSHVRLYRGVRRDCNAEVCRMMNRFRKTWEPGDVLAIYRRHGLTHPFLK